MHEEQQNLALSNVKIKDPIPIRRNKCLLQTNHSSYPFTRPCLIFLFVSTTICPRLVLNIQELLYHFKTLSQYIFLHA
jgi:hypothetical protein